MGAKYASISCRLLEDEEDSPPQGLVNLLFAHVREPIVIDVQLAGLGWQLPGCKQLVLLAVPVRLQPAHALGSRM